MTEFTRNVINIIKSIPVGKVMSYGQVARYAGNPRGVRQVARVLHSMTEKYNLPWHRVVNSKGEIALKSYECFVSQQSMLIADGVAFLKEGKVDLEISGYNPE